MQVSHHTQSLIDQGNADYIRARKREFDALKNDVSTLQHSQMTFERDLSLARNLSALFESYVSSSTQENAAMLQSHGTMKQQLESSERLISLLSDKVLGIVSASTAKIKEFEETQVGHTQKITQLDTKLKEATHRLAQLKSASSKGVASASDGGSRSPRRLGGKVFGGSHGLEEHGGGDEGGGEEGGGGAHGHGGHGGGGHGGHHHHGSVSAGGHHQHHGSVSHGHHGHHGSMSASHHGSISAHHASMSTHAGGISEEGQMGLMLIDKLREVKLEVDSIWGEFRRQNDLNRTQMSKMESRMDDFDGLMKELLASQREMAANHAQFVAQVTSALSSASLPSAAPSAAPANPLLLGGAVLSSSDNSSAAPSNPKRLTVKSAAHKLTLLKRFMEPMTGKSRDSAADGGDTLPSAWDAGGNSREAENHMKISPAAARRDLEAKLAAIAEGGDKMHLASVGRSTLILQETDPNFNFNFG